MSSPSNPPNRYAAIIYAATDPINAVAQLKTTFRVTNKNLYAMIELVCVFSKSFYLKDAENRIVQRNEEAVAPGNYFIVSMGSVLPTPDSPLASDRRHLTTQTGSLRTTSFRKKIRARDRGCVLTGLMALEPDDDDYGMFEAGHVFPLALVRYWHSYEFTDEIDVLSPRASEHPINSTINGMLFTRDAHYLFDAYALAINPQDNYKIAVFTREAAQYITTLSRPAQAWLDNPLRPSDEILIWHHTQAVLTHVKAKR